MSHGIEESEDESIWVDSFEAFFCKIQARHKVWLPIDDNQDGREWRDFKNHQTLNYTPPWKTGQPKMEAQWHNGAAPNCQKM